MNVVERARNIITTPNSEWNTIDAEADGASKVITNYVIPLAAIAAIAAFIGYAFIGVEWMGFRFRGVNWGLNQACIVLVSAITSVYVTALVVDMLAPNFGSEKNFNKSLQLVAYSFTPAWIGGLLAIIPSIALIGALFGLYGLYLMYIGLPKLKHTPADKQVGYFVVIIIVTIVVYIIIGWLLGAIFTNIFGVSYNAGAFDVR
ncbi:MAG TPA: Yip1 family protein [Flavisolibacter sp.]|nr:Yip1 family protein [Flavisolibacter sp.]